AVERHRVVVHQRARAVVFQVGPVAVRVVLVGEVLGFVVHVRTVVPDQFHRVRDDRPGRLVGEAYLLAVSFVEGVAAQTQPDTGVRGLVDAAGGRAVGVRDGEFGVSRGTRDVRVLHEDLVLARFRDLQLPGERVGSRTAAGVNGVVRPVAPVGGG